MSESLTFSEKIVVALVGNPNVGKSTLFNRLTGGKQHTGNWAGKTVDVAEGSYQYKGKTYVLVDLPGTYSLHSSSEEERVALDFICSGEANCTLIVVDATCLERNLSFALQVIETTKRVALCINFMDEAQKEGMKIDISELSRKLQIPVIGISAGKGTGIDELKEMLRNVTGGFLRFSPERAKERVNETYVEQAQRLVQACVCGQRNNRLQRLDHLVLGRYSGKAIMLLLLFLVFWLTGVGANYPSAVLQKAFEMLAIVLRAGLRFLPVVIQSFLVDGIFLTTARVVSVMLPPMVIFFPLFTFLEDFGYLPRAAFMMDRTLQRCGSCGKQVLTMAMGFGCNAAGVMGCRIIGSPKERLLSILTNALVPCNGRFPALIVLVYFIFPNRPFCAALSLTGLILLSVLVTFLSTKVLGKTILRNEDSHFILELPPYRRPCLKKILSCAVKDRILFVLLRAVMVAAPAGALIWGFQYVHIGEQSLLRYLASALNPVALLFGLNGVILLAFLLSFPANELLIPLIVAISSGGLMSELEPIAMGAHLASAGWTRSMALCTLIFVIFHWPCSTTCFTVYKETSSIRWTITAAALPTLIGLFLCMIINLCLN